MGGLCEGLRRAGFDITGAVDKSKFVVPNYRMNFPQTSLYHGDVRDLLKSDWGGREGSFSLDDIDLVSGGPPCQGVSQIGPRDLDDVRNDLFEVFVDTVAGTQPKAVLMENVPNIHRLRGGHFHKEVIEGFQQNGYSNVVRHNLCSENYGLPQTRERAFYFATRDDVSLDYELGRLVEAVARNTATTEAINTWEAISDLPAEVVESEETMPYPDCSVPSDYQREMRLDFDGQIYSMDDKNARGIADHDSSRLYNHHTKDITEKRLERIRHLGPGDNAHSIPDELWNGARPEKYRRLPIDRPSHTLLAQMHRDLSEWVHPKEDRWITVREAMRLQSFHDGFVLGVSEWRQLQQIGNSVPPLLGRVAGEIIKTAIQHSEGKPVSLGADVKLQSTFESW